MTGSHNFDPVVVVLEGLHYLVGLQNNSCCGWSCGRDRLTGPRGAQDNRGVWKSSRLC